MEHIALLCLGIVAFLINWSSARKKIPRADDDPAAEKVPLVMGLYEFLREHALSLRPEEVVLTSGAEEDPYLVVMDMALRRGTATLVCAADGNVSLYLSTGTGTIGGYAYESIRNAAINFVRYTRNYVTNMTPAPSHPLPKVGDVRFYVLTKHGKYFAEDTVEKVNAGVSRWSELFVEANKVITALRLVRSSRGDNSPKPAHHLLA